MIPVRKQSAFSLVELSVVLVILGLLVGGVLAGQSLIRAAELRSVLADIYFYDINVATAFGMVGRVCQSSGKGHISSYSPSASPHRRSEYHPKFRG
jgi:prepilin-type N-terminal cleavage/methylation domain-containing protein